MPNVELYRLKVVDMMGYTKNEQFFLDQALATSTFDEKLELYRNDKNLASDQEAEENNLNSEAVSVVLNHPKLLKQAMICLWQKTSCEYDECDITVEHLELEKLNIEENPIFLVGKPIDVDVTEEDLPSID